MLPMLASIIYNYACSSDTSICRGDGCVQCHDFGHPMSVRVCTRCLVFSLMWSSFVSDTVELKYILGCRSAHMYCQSMCTFVGSDFTAVYLEDVPIGAILQGKGQWGALLFLCHVPLCSSACTALMITATVLPCRSNRT